ncbi:MAG: H(+)-transporting ATPase [Clostridiales bacterium]|jgi:trk system potassium uptake protein TrkH|nr:H(+)-transporting ATPase [Clostridiales bacterium]
MNKLKKMSPARFLALGFACVILLGAIVLYLPYTHNEGVEVKFIDALFTATSAVCVTGLIAIDTADTFNIIGQAVVAILIQIGGLGVASVGVSFILLARKKVDFKDRILVKEALGLGSMKGIVKLVKAILMMTLCFEGAGAFLSFFVFVQDYPLLKAIWMSIFHSVASFNNSGFDIIGGYQNLIPYQSNILLNLTTSGLIIFGGLGFIVIKEVLYKKSFKKLSLHSKVVIIMSSLLMIIGTILIKFTEKISWLGAFFFSTSARTAGFSTYSVGNFTSAGLFVLIVLMFIGASPGSTGGGIKTTTFFAMLKGSLSISTNRKSTCFKRKLPNDLITKAFTVTFLAISLVCINTYLLIILEPQYSFIQLFFEVVSAFGTVGLSTGITPDLNPISVTIIILTMYVGRIGPLTIASIWSFKQISNIDYSEESINIG